MDISFKILRFDPDKDKRPYYRKYTLEVEPGMTVLDGLNEIKWRQDGTLSYRRSCRSAICGSCAMTINGVNRLTCNTQILALKRKTVVVEPLRRFPIIKDLIVDMDPFFEKIAIIKPYLIAHSPGGPRERLQGPEDRKLLDEAVTCILCGACTSSCPSYWYNKNYLGPAALFKAYRFIFDSRDEGSEERLKIISDRDGVWRCHSIFNCVEACPKSLNATYAIAELKKKLVTTKL